MDRSGSNATESGLSAHVRFTPGSDQQRTSWDGSFVPKGDVRALRLCCPASYALLRREVGGSVARANWRSLRPLAPSRASRSHGFGCVELDADLGYQRRLTHERATALAQRLVRCRKDDLEHFAAEAYARSPAMMVSILFTIAAAFWISATARARVRCLRARSGRFLILYSNPRSIWILARMVPRSLNCS
jgi:hypothetical protein